MDINLTIDLAEKVDRSCVAIYTTVNGKEVTILVTTNEDGSVTVEQTFHD